MTEDYTRTKEGDPLTSTGLGDKFTSFEDALNDVDLPDIEREGLRHVHLPSLVPSEFTTLAKAAPLMRSSEQVTISTIQGNGAVPGNLVQVTTATAHGLRDGDRVDIGGTVNYNENDEGPVDVLTPTTFQYYTSGGASAALEVVGTCGGNDSYDRYGNSLPMTVSGATYPFTYQSFASAVPLGPGRHAAAGGNGKLDAINDIETAGGWRFLAYQGYSDNRARISLSSPARIDASGMNIKGVLVRGSYELRDRYNIPGDIGEAPLKFAAIAIGFSDSLNNQYIIERSVRFYSVTAIQRGDLVTSTFLKQSDLDVGNGILQDVFVVISSGVRGHPTSGEEQQDLEVRSYNITVWPMHAGDL